MVVRNHNLKQSDSLCNEGKFYYKRSSSIQKSQISRYLTRYISLGNNFLCESQVIF
eukprot:403376341